MRYLAVALVLLTGCSTSFTPFGETYEPRPEDWPIAVFVSDSAPTTFRDLSPRREPEIPRTAVRIGEAKAMTSSASKDMVALKAMARENGGDGVLIAADSREGTVGIILRWKP